MDKNQIITITTIQYMERKIFYVVIRTEVNSCHSNWRVHLVDTELQSGACRRITEETVYVLYTRLVTLLCYRQTYGLDIANPLLYA